MRHISLVLLALTTLAGTACKKEEESGGKAGAAAKAQPTEAKGGPTKLAKLGLQLDVAGDVEVGDAIGGEGHMLQGASIGAMQIEVATKPQTLDEAKSDADMYSPKNLKADTLADGWALTFENTGSAGKNFFVDVRRTIAGKLYKCSTTGSDAGQAAAVLAACKSLRK